MNLVKIYFFTLKIISFHSFEVLTFFLPNNKNNVIITTSTNFEIKLALLLNIVDAQTIDPEKTAKLAEQFSISEADITHLDRRITARDLSLNAPISNSEEDSMEFIDILEDDTPSPEVLVARTQETEFRQKYLKDAMFQLSERERHIFTERRLKEDPITLEKLGEHYGISRERVRQLENRAYTKVQTLIHSQLIGDSSV